MERDAVPMRLWLPADLPEPPLPDAPCLVVRTLDPQADVDPLGDLMRRAYAGTFDDKGESAEAHEDEAHFTVEGEYGALDPGSSLVLAAEDRLVAATVVTHDRGRPLLAWALTEPQWRGRGVGGALIARTANRLRAAGHDQLTLAVTAGHPARRLYERLGFREDRSLLTPEG